MPSCARATPGCDARASPSGDATRMRPGLRELRGGRQCVDRRSCRHRTDTRAAATHGARPAVTRRCTRPGMPAPETAQLRVVAVTFRFALQNRLGEQGSRQRATRPLASRHRGCRLQRRMGALSRQASAQAPCSSAHAETRCGQREPILSPRCPTGRCHPSSTLRDRRFRSARLRWIERGRPARVKDGGQCAARPPTRSGT